MVTTRSADKRVDGRDEDLVLRSRIIASPASQNSTPSRLRKRAINNGDETTPIKRARRLISVEIQSPRPDTSVNSQSVTQDNDATIVVATKTEVKQDIAPTTEVSNDVDTADSESTPRQHEVFQTPATSRHKRFDSIDPEDTIIVNTDTTSNSQQGYETAEEVIADSDEAPEVSSTKMQTTKSHNAQGPRRRGKGRARASDYFTKTHEDKVLIENAAQTNKASDAIPEVAEVDAQVQKEFEDSINQTSESNSNLESTGRDLDMETTAVQHNANEKEVAVNDSTRKEPEVTLPVEVETSAKRPESTKDAKAEPVRSEHASISLPDSTPDTIEILALSPVQSTDQERQGAGSDARGKSRLSLRPKLSSRSERPHFQDAVVRNYGLNIRLPDPAKSSRSHFVRRKLESRGVKLQSSWPSKRRAFATS